MNPDNFINNQLQNISLSKVQELCVKVEKLIGDTNSKGREYGDEEKSLLCLIVNIAREKTRKDKIEEKLKIVFTESKVAEYVASWYEVK